MPQSSRAESRVSLSVFDAVIIVVGLVLGTFIFKAPSIVAANVDSVGAFVGLWVAGGVIILIGALCYAELAASDPSVGGEYHFLDRAYGRPVAMMFGWARASVIQTGSIAVIAFVLGDYAADLLPLGPYGPGIYAALAIIIFTAVNVVGTLESKSLQIVVTLAEVGAVVAIIAFGLLSGDAATASAPPSAVGTADLGTALIFVLLTYGGWNESAYLTGELKDAPRNIAKVLVLATFILVLLYVLANVALLSVLGLDGLRGSNAVAADMMRMVAGDTGAKMVSLAIVIAAISTLNGTILTGGRVYYSMARDITLLPSVGKWSDRGKTPANGLIAQAVVSLILVAVGSASRDGFSRMVDYITPVFWIFMFLVGAGLFVLRWREPDRVLPFRVPLYPLTPILFCLTSLYMLYSSLAFTKTYALVGLAVLAAGTPLLFFRRRDEPEQEKVEQGT